MSKLTMKVARGLYRKSGIPCTPEKKEEREAKGGYVPGFREWARGFNFSSRGEPVGKLKELIGVKT